MGRDVKPGVILRLSDKDSRSKIPAPVGRDLNVKSVQHAHYLAFRCRTASNNTTPAATETFNDFTGPTVGSDTTKSQRFRVSSCNPLPSPPSTIPTGDV